MNGTQVPRTQTPACLLCHLHHADSEEGIWSLTTALRVLGRACVVARMGPRSSTYLSGTMSLYGHGSRYMTKSCDDKGHLVIEAYTASI